MIKLIIQIPCYNEEKSLPETLKCLPKKIEGIDCVEWLIIDDGSNDRTIEIAKLNGVDHIIRFPQNQGLAKAFIAGIDASCARGADIIVNTDADNQYCADDIPKLIRPILTREADMVVGERPISEIKHFSPLKKALQRFGSFVVRQLSHTDIVDAPSGFRAFSKHAAMQLNVFNEYTYTLETIIQAGHKGIAITSVPIRVNGETRPSRLVKSVFSYVKKSGLTMLRIFVTYRPLFFFVTLGGILSSFGFVLALRFLYHYFMGDGDGMVQSLILAALMMGSGFFLMVTALIADLISVNRKLLENLQVKISRIEDSLSSGHD
ncbi:MAG: glycosyltransferase family 2 protein [Opitutales bacterium]|nr:glycosyltransferase family 2 protein [Opitutales bacterium]